MLFVNDTKVFYTEHTMPMMSFHFHLLEQALIYLTNSFHIHFSIDSFFHKIHIRSIFTKYQYDSIWIRGHLPYLANEPSTSAAKITPSLKTNDATDGLVIIDVLRKLQKKKTISIEELISTYTVRVRIVRSASVSKRFIVYVLFKFIISWRDHWLNHCVFPWDENVSEHVLINLNLKKRKISVWRNSFLCRRSTEIKQHIGKWEKKEEK